MDYLRANRAALGLDAGRPRRASTSTGAQHAARPDASSASASSTAGIPAFDNDVRVAIDRAGRVILGRRLAAPRPRGRVDRAAALGAPRRSPRCSATSASQRARAVALRARRARARRRRFAGGDFARLVLFGAAGGPRLAWHVIYCARPRAALYDAVVDAASGAILYRAEPGQGRRQRARVPEPPGRRRRRRPSTSRTTA